MQPIFVLTFMSIVTPAGLASGDPQALDGANKLDIENRWIRLEEALLRMDSDASREALLAFPQGEAQNAGSFIVNLIEDVPDRNAMERFLVDHFTPDSDWPAKLRPLLGRLEAPGTQEYDPRSTFYPRSALAGLELHADPASIPPFRTEAHGHEVLIQGSPELDFIKRCRLERQVQRLFTLTAARRTFIPMDPAQPFEMGFRWYASWEDQFYLNGEVNQRLMRLGSGLACFFHVVPQPGRRAPLAVYALQAAEWREVRPRKPFWSVPSGDSLTPALIVEVESPGPPGLRGITHPIGGGVSIVFRDAIRKDCDRIRKPWPALPDVEAPVRKMDRLKKLLHDQLEEGYRGNDASLEHDSFELTAVHETIHQALHDLIGAYSYGPSQVEIQGGSGNVLVEVMEILADLSVVTETARRKDSRLALLAAFYGLLDAENVEPRGGRVLASPYRWKSALILRSVILRDGVLQVDFDRLHGFVHGFEKSLMTSCQVATVEVVWQHMLRFLISSGRFEESANFEENIDRQRGYVADRARALQRRRPGNSENDAQTVAIIGVLHDMAAEQPDILKSMLSELTVLTPTLHLFLAERLGATAEDLDEFEDFVAGYALPE